jgi:hypothetical protein
MHNLNIINIIDIIAEQPSSGVPWICPLLIPCFPGFGRLPSPHVLWTWMLLSRLGHLPSLGVPWTWLTIKSWSREGDLPVKSTCSLTVRSMCPLDLPDSKVQVP